MKRTLPVLFALACLASPSAQAAESYDNCSGFIDSVPATITTQGVWCLRADLSTALASGYAITVAVNNVTIDCNHFKLGGLAAGAASQTWGIVSTRLNTVIRNCNIRGFYRGVYIGSGGGNVVEANRFDGNLYGAVFVSGGGSTIRGNLVLDTGGSSVSPDIAHGIEGRFGTDIIDNTIFNVSTNAAITTVYGIAAQNNGHGVVRDNRIKGVVSHGVDGRAYGIFGFASDGMVIRGNDVLGSGIPSSVGIACSSNQSTAFGNVIARFDTGISQCATSGNLVNTN